jgi:hypothetical protein
MIMEDITSFGLGTTSLLVDYAHACVRHATYAINDEGTYGYVTRSLINAQASATGSIPAADLHHSAGSMLRIRQLSMLQEALAPQ